MPRFSNHVLVICIISLVVLPIAISVDSILLKNSIRDARKLDPTTQ